MNTQVAIAWAEQGAQGMWALWSHVCCSVQCTLCIPSRTLPGRMHQHDLSCASTGHALTILSTLRTASSGTFSTPTIMQVNTYTYTHTHTHRSCTSLTFAPARDMARAVLVCLLTQDPASGPHHQRHTGREVARACVVRGMTGSCGTC